MESGPENDHVVGGYYIVRPARRADWQSDLLPEIVQSVAACVCGVGPNANWAVAPEPERTLSDPLGVPEGRVAEAAAWIIEASERSHRWPDVLASPDAGRTLAHEFALPLDELILVGIGLPTARVAEFLEGDGGEEGCVPQTVASREALAPGGHPLGYELLQVDHEIEHSWLCYGSEVEAATELDVRPNERGFIDSLSDAERVAAWADDEETCLPGFPFDPWLIVRYEWA